MEMYSEEVKQILLDVDSTIGDIDEQTELIESGIIDSFAIFSLIVMIEIKWKIKVPKNDISSVNFKNIESIARLIQRLNGGSKSVELGE